MKDKPLHYWLPPRIIKLIKAGNVRVYKSLKEFKERNNGEENRCER